MAAVEQLDLQSRDTTSTIPEIIEEKRKDSEGRISTVKYVKGKLLGKGGFAKCFVGIQLPAKTNHALKIVSKSTLAKARARTKFQTEIKIHMKLNHIHVVKFERYFEDPSNAYILMELCHNNSMSDMLKRRKKLTEPEVRYYMSQLVNSLVYLHSHLIIHRDLKLGNIFLDSDMRVKVGDFGLATRLTHAEERKRTICGTPNYIAPEILEGKEGHSFEVDIWSTGVIMYTLLYGKPPFESKDVKSTYKRILANSYSFPDHTVVCEHAKTLIQSMLQARPENRPGLQHILQHSFFTLPSAYMPTSLPESALREPPSVPLPSEIKLNSFGRQPRVADENDPHAINRIREPSTSSSSSSAPSAPHKPASGAYERVTAPSSQVLAQREREPSGAQGGPRPRTTAPSARNATPAPTAAQPPLASGAAQAPTSMNCNRPSAHPTNSASMPLAPKSLKPHNPLAVPQGEQGYNRKFEIYNDRKGGVVAPERGVEDGALTSRSSRSASAPRVSPLPTPPAPTATLSRYSCGPSASAATAVDNLQMELENVHLSDESVKPLRTASTGRGKSGTAGAGEADTRDVLGGRSVPEAWAWHDDERNAFSDPNAKQDQRSTAGRMEPHRDQRSTKGVPTSAPSSGPAADSGPAAHSEPERTTGKAQDYEAMQLGTPPEQVMGKRDGKVLGTLETMHEMLSQTCAGLGGDDSLLGDAPFKPSTLVAPLPATRRKNLLLQAATVWVVRYVDYTSKYGLGFLLNTGSAGVYFNDSTKIVLSSDGSVFQYIERRRRDAPTTSGPASPTSEHTIQTHLLSCYPVELHKKVTLLCHFRNYLIDQHRNGAPQHGDDEGAGMDGNPKIPVASVDSQASGASNTVTFGVSSAKYVPSPTDIDRDRASDGEPEMPFLKKWVRTRHAILFRLSNRTVQVVFFDRSEVLLSSEARIVTYVNKQGDRSEHSLEEVLQTDRKDIAKRLKYTKDIMYRLINIQAR